VPVLPQMIGERLDAVRQERNLDLGRTGVTRGARELGDDLLLVFGRLHRCQSESVFLCLPTHLATGLPGRCDALLR
jgi:hypothetical protein